MRRLEIQFKFPLVTWRRGRNYQRVGKRVGWILERVESIVSSFEYTSKYGVDQAEFTFFRFWIIALLGHYHPLIEKLLFFIPTKIKNERPFLFSWKNSSFISVELINRLPPFAHFHTTDEVSPYRQSPCISEIRFHGTWWQYLDSHHPWPSPKTEKGNGNGEAEGEKAETRGPSPDIENTSTSFGRRDVVMVFHSRWWKGGKWWRPWNSERMNTTLRPNQRHSTLFELPLWSRKRGNSPRRNSASTAPVLRLQEQVLEAEQSEERKQEKAIRLFIGGSKRNDRRWWLLHVFNFDYEKLRLSRTYREYRIDRKLFLAVPEQKRIDTRKLYDYRGLYFGLFRFLNTFGAKL